MNKDLHMATSIFSKSKCKMAETKEKSIEQLLEAVFEISMSEKKYHKNYILSGNKGHMTQKTSVVI